MIDQTTLNLKRTIAFPPAFASKTNSHTAAILLAQIDLGFITTEIRGVPATTFNIAEV